MKQTVTWVVLANAEDAHVMASNGRGTGLAEVAGKVWHAEPPVEYTQRPGVGHSSHGPGIAAYKRRDPRDLAERKFATQIAGYLAEGHAEKAFDRLVLVASPHMLGVLREELEDAVKHDIVAEVDKDLTKLGPADVATRLAHVLEA